MLVVVEAISDTKDRLSRCVLGGEPMTTNGDFGELRQRFDLESP